MICSCSINEVKPGKLHNIASYNCNFILKLPISKGVKKWWLFDRLYKTYTDCFVLEVLNESRFQNRFCIASQKEEKKVLYITYEEMRDKPHLTLDNSEEGQVNY